MICFNGGKCRENECGYYVGRGECNVKYYIGRLLFQDTNRNDTYLTTKFFANMHNQMCKINRP